MAERRMFTKKVTDDDNFMSLSASAQALYLHLSMSADDDGFCNQVSIAMFKAHASIQDLEALLSKRYIYQFENGVIVIKHWRMANALRKDRYTPTAFQEELKQLKLKGNGAYTMGGESVVDIGLPSGCQVVADCLPQDSIDKDSIDKDSIDNNNPPLSPHGGKITWQDVKTMIAEKNFPSELERTVTDWASYKIEKRQGYKETGYKSLLTQIQKNYEQYGEQQVINVIERSMSANYQGICWDWLKRSKPTSGLEAFING